MADQPGGAMDQETGGNYGNNGNPGSHQGIVFGLLGFGAVVCVCVVAVVMAFLFSKVMQPPNINQTVNLPQTSPSAPSAPPAPSQSNPASREYTGVPSNLALPGEISSKSSLSPKTRQVAVQRGTGYPLPQPGQTSAEVMLRSQVASGAVRFLIRGADKGRGSDRGTLPYPVRAYNPNLPVLQQDRAAYGAIPKESNTPPVELSDLPDVEFQEVSTQSGGLRVDVTRLVKTSKTEKYNAVKGLQFLLADLQITNTTSRDCVLKAEDMEARESGGVSYGADPDLLEGGVSSQTVEGGGSINLTVAFQVPDSVEMKAIAMEIPGSSTPLLIPLNKK